jgi:Flp pilus assembly pilin Flp
MFVLARRFAKDESGTALEYCLTVAGISFGLIMAMDALDPELRTTLAKVTSQLATLVGGSASQGRVGLQKQG